MTSEKPSKTEAWVNRGLTALLVVIIGLNVWWYFLHSDAPPMVDQAAPEFALPTLTADGKAGPKLALASHKGKVVMLDFWATYCAPCKRQMPILEELHRELPSDRFTLVSVNMDDPRQRDRLGLVASVVRQGGYTFPIVLDNGPTAAAYQVKRIPTLVIIKPDGTVGAFHTGLSSKRELLDEIRDLMPSAPQAALSP